MISLSLSLSARREVTLETDANAVNLIVTEFNLFVYIQYRFLRSVSLVVPNRVLLREIKKQVSLRTLSNLIVNVRASGDRSRRDG